MYDHIVIGGGIAGIYVAMHLKNVLLLEASDYWGGRIHTHVNPHYECGAGRYHGDHKMINSLVKMFNLTAIQLGKSDFRNIGMDVLPDADSVLKKHLPVESALGKKHQSFSDHCAETLPPATLSLLKDMYGYTSEFDMNAHSSRKILKQVLRGHFYVVKEGLGELVNRMVEKVPQKKLNERVVSVDREGTTFKVTTLMSSYECKNVIFAVPAAQLAPFHLIPPLAQSCVRANNLFRVYAQYEEPWAENVKSFTTSSFLRHVIPISPTLVMVTYTEGADSMVYFDGAKVMDEAKLSTKIHHELRRFFPNIPTPTKIFVHYWPVGDHIWLPGFDADAIGRTMLNPADRVYVCGEAFSQIQSWIEGALQTAAQVCRLLKPSATRRKKH
jgi:monoamine oxidase